MSNQAETFDLKAVVANPENVSRFASFDDNVGLQEVILVPKVTKEKKKHMFTVKFQEDKFTRFVMADNLIQNLGLQPQEDGTYDVTGINQLMIEKGVYKTNG